MSTMKPCGRESCTASFIAADDRTERDLCLYPQRGWTRTKVFEKLNLPLCSRLAIHGTSISNVNVFPTEGEGIVVELTGFYNGPEGEEKLTILATDAPADSYPRNVIFSGPGYLCEAFGSDELCLNVYIPIKHRFETVAITGRSVVIKGTLSATRTIHISAAETVTGKLSAKQIFAGAQGNINVTLQASGDTDVNLFSTKGNIYLTLDGFVLFSALCSGSSTDVRFEDANASRGPKLAGNVRADVGEIIVE